MRFLLVTRDDEIADAAKTAFDRSDTLEVFSDWKLALESAEGADMMFIDLLATLEEPHKIAGYERFAHAKMAHTHAASVPLVLIAAPHDYELDFMSGWPDFVLAQLRRPVQEKVFRRAATWI